MTEGQIRYQTILENQRHNLAMERIGEQEVNVSKRSVAIKEAEESRAAELFPYQKKLTNSQTQNNLSNVWANAGKVAESIIKGARGLFGLFGDAASFGSSISTAAGGYYQGSLFA